MCVQLALFAPLNSARSVTTCDCGITFIANLAIVQMRCTRDADLVATVAMRTAFGCDLKMHMPFDVVSIIIMAIMRLLILST
jgi:hypothetical protein